MCKVGNKYLNVREWVEVVEWVTCQSRRVVKWQSGLHATFIVSYNLAISYILCVAENFTVPHVDTQKKKKKEKKRERNLKLLVIFTALKN